MKHIYASIFLLFLVYQISNAQCTPNAYAGNHGLVLPDSANFPHAQVGTAFSTTLQLQVAHDTSGTFTVPTYGAVPGNFVFDSITIYSVKTSPTLPVGVTLTYSCNPSDCKFKGGKTGCVDVSVSAISSPGVYKIIVDLAAKGTFTPTALPVPFPNQKIAQKITKYNLVVDALGTFIDEYQGNLSDLHFIEIAPNPSSDKASIKFVSPNATTSKITMTTIEGKVISSQTTSTVKGLNDKTIDLSAVSNGIYFLSIENEGAVITKKLVVQ